MSALSLAMNTAANKTGADKTNAAAMKAEAKSNRLVAKAIDAANLRLRGGATVTTAVAAVEYLFDLTEEQTAAVRAAVG